MPRSPTTSTWARSVRSWDPSQPTPIPPQVCTAFLGLQPGKVDGYVRQKADDWAAGYNVGLLFLPWEGTRIGLTYRSRIEHTLTGDARFSVPKEPRFSRPRRVPS